MKNKIVLFVMFIIIILIITGCRNNVIKETNEKVFKEDKFLSISIDKGEDRVTIARLVQRNKKEIKEFIIWYTNKSYYTPINKVIHNKNIGEIIYNEYIYNDNKCNVTAWRGNQENKLEIMHQYTINKPFKYIFTFKSFQESPKGIAIKHNKIDSVNYLGNESFINKDWKLYKGKFDLSYDKTVPSGYKADYLIWLSENSNTVYEFYNFSGKRNYYRRFWYGDDVELVLNDENDDFEKIFKKYFKKAKFDLFIDQVNKKEKK
ncbi:MAG: hypothetical protein ACOCRK_07605 [bacterium]